MSVTITNETNKAEALVSGLRKHLDDVKQIGITADTINKMEEACKILLQKDKEAEELRKQVTLKSRENQALLTDLKSQMLTVRQAVKSRFMQPDWAKYGVQDKR